MINNYLNKVIKYVCRIDINQLIQNLSTYEDEINSLNERLINSSDANNIKSEQIALLESKINSLNEQLTHSIDANNIKSEQIALLESKINNQTNKFNCLTDKINTLRIQNIELKSIHESNKTKIDSLQNERNNLSSDIANKIRTINEQNLRNTTLQEELDQTKLVLQNSNQEYKRMQEYTIQMHDKCSELELNIQIISDEKNTLTCNIAELQIQITDNNNEIARLKEKNNQTSATNEELLRNQTHLHEELTTIRAEKDALLQQLQQYEEEINRNKQQQEEHRQKIESLSSEKEALNAQVGTLQNSIADYESKIKTLEKENTLQQVEKEQPEEVCHANTQTPTEDKSSEIEQQEFSIYQDSSENKNNITEKKQEETTIESNTTNKDNLATNSIPSETDSHEDTMTSIDFVADSDESLDSHEQVVPDESSLPSSFEIIDEDVDNTSTSNTENKIEDEQNDATTDASMMDGTEVNEDVLDDDSLPCIYDNSLVPADKLSIPEVYDVKENKIINSKVFFSQNENELILWRRNLEEEYSMGRRSRLICPECKQPVKISGHKLTRGRVCYFAHFRDSNDCLYKTGTHRTKEEIERLKYSLVQESDRHKHLKTAIASALKGERSISMGVDNVECEKRIKSDIPYLNWRRPDVYAEYNGRKYVFELQLSTTFISVIVDRDIFYRLNGYNIIWVFNFEDNSEYVNLHNLMCKDIYYANKRNVFIFDAHTEKLSKERGELVLKCRWLDENGIWSKDQYVTLDMLQYDEENCKPFFKDADRAYLEKYPNYTEKRKLLEHSREYLLNAMMERQKQEEELENRKAEERSNLQTELLNNDEYVSRFRTGTKYGYQYRGTTIIPAKYTSAENIRNDGYAQVGFNRKIGLVRKDGREIVPVEYKTIDIINSQHGIILASYKRIDLYIADEKFSLLSEYDDKNQNIIKEVKNKTTKYILQTSTYSYHYTSSYYGNHPICRKKWEGYSNKTLFSVIEENDFCIILVGDRTYFLSRNNLSFISESYSELKSTGIDKIFIAKDINTNLWGVINYQGNVITNFEYVEIIATESEYLIVRFREELSHYGVIDYNGREFIMPQFEAIIYLNSNRFAFRNGHLWGICDNLGNILHDAEYTYIRGISSECIMASTLESYSSKWIVNNNIPSYIEENVKLCLLDETGNIDFRESNKGKYHIRRSGDLYSILSEDKTILVTYSLSYIEFIDRKVAIIKNSDGISGFFIDDQCKFFKGCKNIEQLSDDSFKFENINGNFAIGNYTGPICDYIYNDIKNIDSNHYVVSKRIHNEWSPSLYYFIINKEGSILSAEFSHIDTFKEGLASAVYQGRKGIIDVDGIMQENKIDSYGVFFLCEKFENYYFCNNEIGLISEEYQSIENLFKLFFVVRKRGENNVKLYSLEENKATEDSFTNITHLVDDLFITKKKQFYDVYQLYKKLECISSEYYSSISLLDNGYIVLKKTYGGGYKILRKDGSILNDMEYDSIIETNDQSFKVKINGDEGLIDLNGNAIVERTPFENGFVLTRCFADCGLENNNGNTIFSLDEHLSSIEFIEGNLIKICKNNKYALCSLSGISITELKFTSISFESTNRYAVVEDQIEGYIDSEGNYIETSSTTIAEDGTTIFVLMGKYGLRNTNGNIIIQAQYSSIDYLTKRLLVVKNNSFVALFNFEGNPLTDFKYSNITYSEDGSIQAYRNNSIGILDENGNEITEDKHFKGGCIKTSFGDYFVTNTENKTIIPKGYSKIEILDNEGILSLWKNNKVAIWNSNNKTEPIYNSVKSIGEGFFVVSRIISYTKRERQKGYGYKGNPYTYYTTDIIREKRYGIIDKSLRTILPCKFSSISDFDDKKNITIINLNARTKSLSLQDLHKKASHIFELTKDVVYNAIVRAFIPIGIIVNIQNNTYVIHKQYLFKNKRDFKKGESLNAKFAGLDKNGYPTWETSCCVQESIE